MRNIWIVLASATVGAAGIALGGWFVGHGVVKARTGDRYVTVKGVSERPVKADLAVWPLRFVATGNDLAQVQDKIDRDTQIVLAFLKAAGIADSEVRPQELEVIDRLAQAYRSGAVDSRFIVNRTLMVRTVDVERVNAASQRIGELVAAGVVLGGEGRSGPFYAFTLLNRIKPAMIAEAMASARDGAEQFAADSHSRVAAIRTANQGVFQVLARDDTPGLEQTRQIDKTVRVVATIEYFLAD